MTERPGPGSDPARIGRSFASSLRNAVDDCLDVYEHNQGVGRDPYWQQPTFHSMAEAEYLATLHEMRRGDLLGPHHYNKKLTASLSRLQNGAVESSGHQIAWGLGFPYREAPADEPYVITTALIVRALNEASQLGSADADELMRRAAKWLDEGVAKTSVPGTHGPTAVPHFSPHVSSLVINAAAVWAAGLAETRLSLMSEIEPVEAWIVDRYEAGVGWTYTEDDTRVDLVHQCYILSALGALRGFAQIEQMAVESLAPFSQGGRLIDKFDLLPIAEAIRGVAGTPRLWLQPHASEGLLFHPDAARPWGVGALLVLLSQLEREGNHPEYWRALARRHAQRELETLDVAALTEKWGLRQMMHLAHGLAAVLGNLRVRTAEATVGPLQAEENPGDVI